MKEKNKPIKTEIIAKFFCVDSNGRESDEILIDVNLLIYQLKMLKLLKTNQ